MGCESCKKENRIIARKNNKNYCAKCWIDRRKVLHSLVTTNKSIIKYGYLATKNRNNRAYSFDEILEKIKKYRILKNKPVKDFMHQHRNHKSKEGI